MDGRERPRQYTRLFHALGKFLSQSNKFVYCKDETSGLVNFLTTGLAMPSGFFLRSSKFRIARQDAVRPQYPSTRHDWRRLTFIVSPVRQVNAPATPTLPPSMAVGQLLQIEIETSLELMIQQGYIDGPLIRIGDLVRQPGSLPCASPAAIDYRVGRARNSSRPGRPT